MTSYGLSPFLHSERLDLVNAFLRELAWLEDSIIIRTEFCHRSSLTSQTLAPFSNAGADSVLFLIRGQGSLSNIAAGQNYSHLEAPITLHIVSAQT